MFLNAKRKRFDTVSKGSFTIEDLHNLLDDTSLYVYCLWAETAKS